MASLSDYVALQSGIPEAPTDGQNYARRGQDASWQVTLNKAESDIEYAPYVHTHPYVGLTGGEVVDGQKEWRDPMGVQATPNGSYAITTGGSVNLTGGGSNYFINGVAIETFSEAPIDGEVYGRSNAGWVLVSIDGGTISNLTMSYSTNFVTINNSGGQDATINAATTLLAGVMSNTDKFNLDAAIQSVNLSLSRTNTGNTINNDQGDGVSLLAASSSFAGLMTAANWTTLSNAITSVNLGVSYGSTSVTITNDEGSNATIAEATNTVAGMMSGVRKQYADASNSDRILGLQRSSTTNTLVKNKDPSTTQDIVISGATASFAGLMTAADKTNLDSL